MSMVANSLTASLIEASPSVWPMNGDALPGLLMAMLLAGLAGAMLLAGCLRRLAWAHGLPGGSSLRHAAGRLWRDEHATATLEFTLVFPILLFLILLLTQSTLLMGGSLVCTHAAYAATRSAVVMIPLNDPGRGEPFNTVNGQADSHKMQRIRQAAVMALLPVAGRMPEPASPLPQARELVDGLASYHRAHGQSPPAWIDRLMPRRLHYADAHTSVTLLRPQAMDGRLVLTPIQGVTQVGPREPITVQVHHKLSLAVPYVGWLFADGRHSPELGGSLYTRLTRQCTMTNEGIINQLPPTPALRRIP